MLLLISPLSVQVWEVVAQLIGLALSIALLNRIEATGDPTNAVWAWGAIQSLHVALRFKSLSVIQLPTLNQKRSCILVNAFLQEQALPGNQTVISACAAAAAARSVYLSLHVHKVDSMMQNQ